MHSFRSGRLGKAALATLLLSALAACGGGGGGGGGGDGGGTNNNGGSGNNGGAGGGGGGTVTPPPTLSRLTLTGVVTDAPIANAVVTATIGGQTFTATADANGNYSVEVAVEESATGGFITLTAKGAGSQSYVEFTSLLGAFDALKTQAGSDSILSNSENFATQITNVSTALAVLLQQANGGQPVNSQTLLATLSPTLSGQQLLELATAIKLLVDEADDYPLPSGQTSLHALLTDTTAREQLVAAVYQQDPTVFINTSNAIVADATLTRPIAITAATLPATLMAATLDDLDVDTYAEMDRGVSYTFNTDGTGTASTGTWHRNMTWTISGASVEIAYEEEVMQLGALLMVCPQIDGDYGALEYPYWYTIEGATLTLLKEGVLATTETRHTDGPICALQETQVVTVARNIFDADDFQAIDIDELRDSTRTVWVHDPAAEDPTAPNVAAESIVPDIAELHANGAGSTLTFGKQFTWSLDSSGRVLNITFDDGVTAKIRSLRDLNDVATDVLYEFTLPTGRRVEARPSLRVDTQLAFAAQNVIGRHYRFGIGDANLPPEFDGFRYRVDADGGGSSEYETTAQDGAISVTRVNPFQWSIDSSDLVFQFTKTAANVFDCDLTDPSCFVYRDIRIVPLAREGSRTYWFQSSRRGQPAIGDGFSRINSISYYDYEPFEAPAVVNSKASTARSKVVPERRESIR